MTLDWISTAAVVVVVVLSLHFYTLFKLSNLRKAGVYPKAGQASSADVERLVKSGFPVLAIRCYRELHGCSLRQARAAVQALSSMS